MLVHSPIPSGDKEIISRWGWPEEWKSWNWQGNEGTPLQVSIYTRCDEVRLEIDGQEIGTKKVSEEIKLTAHFDVPYQPGELTAIGFNEGKEVARQVLKTAGKPAQIKISAEENDFPGIENDLTYFNVEVLDENGILVPDAENTIDFEISGSCKMQAVGSENPKEMQSFQQPTVKTFRGRCQLVVKLNEVGGEVVVTVKSVGLKSAKAEI
jgi:beta-galactosidase